jgi:cytochrome P450
MLLSKHPEAMQKLREEHVRVFGPNVQDTFEMLKSEPHKINELDYTTSVIKETLRMYPVGFGAKVAPEGSTLTFNGKAYPIDRDFAINSMMFYVHRDPNVYDNPNAFWPERFMDPDAVPRSAFLSFERGPRACLGQLLAVNELRVILLLTVRDFDFEVANLKPNKTPRADFMQLETIYGDMAYQELGLEAKPRGGMMMKVSKRV